MMTLKLMMNLFWVLVSGLYSSGYSSQVPTFSLGQWCSVLYVVLVLPTIWGVSQINYLTKNQACQSGHETIVGAMWKISFDLINEFTREKKYFKPKRNVKTED